MRRLLFALPILLYPNILHVPYASGFVPGVNLANMLLLMLVLAIPPRRPDTPEEGTGLLTAPLMLLFLSITIAFLIAVFTQPGSLLADLTQWKDYLLYPMLYFVYRRSRLDLQTTRHLLALLLLVAIIAALESVLKGIMADSFSSFDDNKRIAGPFGGYRMSNRAGVFFAMFLPLLVAFALFMKGHRFWRLLALGGIGLVVLAIMVSFSRQAYLIAVVTTALLLLRRHLVLAGLLALATVPALSLLPESITQRVVETQQVDETGEAELDSSTVSRFEIWDGAWRMWQDHPAGVGLSRFPEYIGQYTPEHQGRDAHSSYFLLLAEAGPLGLVALLWLVWRLLKLALLVRRSAPPGDNETRVLALGFTLSVIAMAMGNLYGTSFHEGLIMANFWILCGLVDHYARLKRHAHSAYPVAPIDLGLAIRERFPLAGRITPGYYRPQVK